MMIYRGISYEPSVVGYETSPSEKTGVYRGVVMHLRQNQPLKETSRTLPLTYRGVKYNAQF